MDEKKNCLNLQKWIELIFVINTLVGSDGIGIFLESEMNKKNQMDLPNGT